MPLQAFEKTSGAAFGKTWDVLGQAEEGLKNFERAEELLRRGLAVREKLLGEDHPDVFESLDHLAKVEGELGKQAEADALAKRAMGLREAGGGASAVRRPVSRSSSEEPVKPGDRPKERHLSCRASRSRCIEGEGRQAESLTYYLGRSARRS